MAEKANGVEVFVGLSSSEVGLLCDLAQVHCGDRDTASMDEFRGETEILARDLVMKLYMAWYEYDEGFRRYVTELVGTREARAKLALYSPGVTHGNA